MLKKILLVLIAFCIPAFAAQLPPLPLNQCLQHAIYGFPTAEKQNTQICRTGYVLAYDGSAKIPIWVSYTLTPAHATGCFERSNAFAEDKSLGDQASKPKDYAKSGYDIGHQANDGDMRWSFQTEIESFILSNMAPQLPSFNRGIWKKLEEKTRAWAIGRQHKLLIYVGPVYSKQDPTIGKGMVTVPHAFFKIIVDTETQETLVYLFKHEGSSAGLDTFITSLAEVQRQTGVVFPLSLKPVFTSGWDTKPLDRNRACALN